MSQHARIAKQRLRLIRKEALAFLSPWWEHEPQRSMNEEYNRLAVSLAIPSGWEPISHKKRVAFRYPKANERFVNTDGGVDRLPYTQDKFTFGGGPRWIIRKIRRRQ